MKKNSEKYGTDGLFAFTKSKNNPSDICANIRHTLFNEGSIMRTTRGTEKIVKERDICSLLKFSSSVSKKMPLISKFYARFYL